MEGTVFKRCYCREPVIGPEGVTAKRELGQACPKLWRRAGAYAPDHGSWWFQLEVPVPLGTARRHLRRGGHSTKDDAEAALEKIKELLSLADRADKPDDARTTIADMIRAALAARTCLPDADELRGKLVIGQPIDTAPTVETFLREWIRAKRKALAHNTYRSYTQQIEQYLIPALGHHRLDRLRATHVQAVFDEIAERSAAISEENAARNTVAAEASRAWHAHEASAARAARAMLRSMPPFRRPVGASSIQRIRDCLRSALSDAARQQLVTVNVAKLVNIAPGRRPKPMMWTEERVARWRETGELPGPVMVWTAEQTVAFLRRAKNHPLYSLYLLIAYSGLRRGEACAVRWADIDFTTGKIDIRQQLVQHGWRSAIQQTKTEAGERTVIAVDVVLKAIARTRRTQREAKLAAGKDWVNLGLAFTMDNGQPWHPDHVLEQFQRLTREADLPPIRLHDLRHGAATHALSAGVDMKTVSEMLGHSSIVITADTYTSVADEAKRAASEKLADILALS